MKNYSFNNIFLTDIAFLIFKKGELKICESTVNVNNLLKLLSPIAIWGHHLVFSILRGSECLNIYNFKTKLIDPKRVQIYLKF